MNELRVELYDHDDDPVDETPDFLGQVVMRGHGRDGLPDVAVEYRLAKKMALPPGAETGVSNWRARFEVEESELEVAEKAGKNARRLAAYNEMVGSVESRVLPTLRRFNELGVAGEELPAVKPVESATRNVTARELEGPVDEND